MTPRLKGGANPRLRRGTGGFDRSGIPTSIKVMLCGILLSLTAAAAGVEERSPTATPAPVSSKWQLDVAFHDPQRISVTLPGESTPRTYWYFLYRVTNNTGKDIPFFPSVALVTDSLKSVVAGDGIHPAVYDAIARRHEKEYPFFFTPAKVTGILLQGESNSRTTAAVFEDFDPAANEFVIYASGFSGELKRVTNPAFAPDKPESDDNPPYFLLRRTLAVTYRLPGDEQTRPHATPVRLKREWVMR